MATTRQVMLILETYQSARDAFANSIAEWSTDPKNVDMLHTAGIMGMIRPLLIDCIFEIQQAAAIGVARLANHREDLAVEAVGQYLLPQLTFALKQYHRFSKKASASALRSVARHSADLGEAVAECGALDELVACLEEFDPSVREVGATALGNISKHSRKLADYCVEAGAIPLLVLCAQDPDLGLKRAAIGSLADIAKHAPELARAVVSSGIVTLIAGLITHEDLKLKRQVTLCLGQIARHTMDLAKVLVAAGVFPNVYLCLNDADHQLRRNAAAVVREVVKHTPQLARYVASTGGVAALVNCCAECRGNDRLPAIMALGYIAAYEGPLATTIIQLNGVRPLLDALTNEQEDHIQSASAWSLGHLGRHSPMHSLAVSEAGVLTGLVFRLLTDSSSEDLRAKCKKAMKAVVQRLTHVPALDSLLQGPILPTETLKHVVAQLAEVLPNDPEARTNFVTSGGLEKLLQVNFTLDLEVQADIDKVKASYPTEVIQYYEYRRRD